MIVYTYEKKKISKQLVQFIQYFHMAYLIIVVLTTADGLPNFLIISAPINASLVWNQLLGIQK